MLKNFICDTLTAIFKNWMITWLQWLCLSIFTAWDNTWEYYLKDTHPSCASQHFSHCGSIPVPQNVSSLEAVFLPHVFPWKFSMFMNPHFLMRNHFIKAFPVSCSFLSLQRQTLCQRPACWEISKSDVLSQMLKGVILGQGGEVVNSSKCPALSIWGKPH